MQRRDFIGSTVATALIGPTLMASESKELSWIDAHVHVWTPDIQAYPLSSLYKKEDMSPTSFTPEELFTHCKPEGVYRIVLIQMSYYQFDNRYMLDCIEKHPGVFSGVAIIDDTKSDVASTMKELSRKGVRGFRLYTDKEKASKWAASESMNAMWTCGADTGLSMCLLANPDALSIVEKQCERFPKTRVVIDHFARIGIDGSIRTEDVDNLCRLSKFKNLTVKISAYYALGKKKAPYTDMADFVKRLKSEYGSDRLMWASDCPFQVEQGHTYRDSIAIIRDRLDFLTESDKSWMLRGTAEKVFFG